MSKTIGVCLSGCGNRDGSEIHESVLALLALYQAGVHVVCMAPDRPQTKVIDFYKGVETGETRNVLVESARIARSDIRDLAKIKAGDLDGLVFPGGLGAALNLCDYATAREKTIAIPDVARLVKDMVTAGKPIGAICIAPVILAAVIGREMGKQVSLTIGNDASTAEHISIMGACHVDCGPGDAVIDKELKVATSPAYMLGKNTAEIWPGIEKAVRAVVDMA